LGSRTSSAARSMEQLGPIIATSKPSLAQQPVAKTKSTACSRARLSHFNVFRDREGAGFVTGC
jgi:hypothetical protein